MRKSYRMMADLGRGVKGMGLLVVRIQYKGMDGVYIQSSNKMDYSLYSFHGNKRIHQLRNGESPVYRYPTFRDKLLDRPEENLFTMKDVLINSANKFAKQPALGTINRKEPETSSIEYLTYEAVLDQARLVGSGILAEQLFSELEGGRLRVFGIFSKNRAEWTIADIAACLYSMTTIPIYDTLGDQNITYVFQHAQLTSCFVNDSAIKSLLKCKDFAKVNRLICFDPFSAQQAEAFRQRGVKLIPYKQLLSIGANKPVDYNLERFKVRPEDCLTFSYTSGTTGAPKAAMISHRNFTSFLAAEKSSKHTKFCSSDVVLSYLPLPHILEREFLFGMLAVGARVVYYSGDVQKIKDDLAVVQPTVFVSVPRLYSRFHEVLTGKFAELQGMTKTMLECALSTKMQNLANDGSYTHWLYDKVFFSKTRAALGGRVRLMISGSAPLLPQVQNFLKVCMCAPLIEGYGQTETTGAMLVSDANDPQVRHVGGPTCNFEFKLVDIPEMQYLSTDKDAEGNSTPRGEIWVRGPGVFMGYFRDEAKTRQAITPDGWLKTGDVGALSAKTQAVSIIDRKKNIFKLQQGQYVAAEKVENTYMKGDKLAEIFIHGESTETFVIVIAVPHPKAVQEMGKKLNIKGTFQQLCKNRAIRIEFVNYLAKIGKEAGLQGFQQAKNIYLEPESFQTKGILTSTMKIQRHEAKKFYRAQIDQLYKQGILK